MSKISVKPQVNTYTYKVLPEAKEIPETPAPELKTIPETPPPSPEPSFILQEVLLEVPESKAEIVKSSGVSENSVILSEKDAYAKFKPVPAVPADHVYSAVDYMAAPTPVPTSRIEDIVPIFDDDIDVIPSEPEVR